MDKILRLLIIYLLGFAVSCGYVAEKTEKTVEIKKEPEKENNYRVIKKNQPPPLIIKPAVEKISPLENRFFTFSADNAPLKTVLYAVAKDAGLNIAISPDINPEIPVTANFNNTPVKTALEIITDLAGVYYEIKGNVIYIKATKTKVFHLPYVHSKSKYKADLGGDVLGSSGTTGGYSGGTTGTAVTSPSVANLKGDFSLKYENPNDINEYYKQLEDSLKKILSV
ncbi:MAG TPA: hypothetical protein ENK22_10590, partial [Persephonella sp.]|nr:hypothetical protein [Persephonella sp.]